MIATTKSVVRIASCLLCVALLGWSPAALPYQTYCKISATSRWILKARVPAGKRAAFIEYLESYKENFALGAHYVGGAESDDSISIGFLDEPEADPELESRMDIWADNKKPTSVFFFYFQRCNTTRAFKPYIDSARKSIVKFGDVKVTLQSR